MGEHACDIYFVNSKARCSQKECPHTILIQILNAKLFVLSQTQSKISELRRREKHIYTKISSLMRRLRGEPSVVWNEFIG